MTYRCTHFGLQTVCNRRLVPTYKNLPPMVAAKVGRRLHPQGPPMNIIKCKIEKYLLKDQREQMGWRLQNIDDRIRWWIQVLL